jgi:hypothetical protein
LLLPAAGYRSHYSGALYYRGNNGNYWSSSENGSNNAWNLNFNGGNANTNNNNRRNGFSVRCVAAFNINRSKGAYLAYAPLIYNCYRHPFHRGLTGFD